ncbi:hypothetical protein TD95_001805 [Thielaviopsis punctulata]|uniref:Protein kinase domain-containing protein n=1 Tax=Thielaviopsis punctulata TaxID=72032 RepID=A0A0F4ZAE4_9PEZI|nr:hypothetical protein TD95_001805 [Thielaviopsis punctulata]
MPYPSQGSGSDNESQTQPHHEIAKHRRLQRQRPRNPLRWQPQHQPQQLQHQDLSAANEDTSAQQPQSAPGHSDATHPQSNAASYRLHPAPHQQNAPPSHAASLRRDMARESTDHLSPMVPLAAMPSRASSISMAAGPVAPSLPPNFASRLNLPNVSAAKQKAIEDARKKQARVITEAARGNVDPPPYVLEELIGKGSYGRVYRARALEPSGGSRSHGPDNMQNIASKIKNLRLNNFQTTEAPLGDTVAVKIIDIEASDRANPDAHTNDSFKEFRKEVEALRRLEAEGARNINHIIECLGVGRTVWMVTQYCAGGSVSTLMKPNKPRGLDEKCIVPLLREVAEALRWVHRAGIVHRDIKCANVLVDENGGVQLADFGVATFYGEQKDSTTAGVSAVGTPHWMAPELLDSASGHHKHGAEVDIWSFGAMAYEMATGLPPYAMEESASDPAGLARALQSRPPRLQGFQYSEDLKSIIEYCLQIDPYKRPSVDVIQQHPYIAGTEISHPRESLTALVKSYKTWEARGGSRDSLFMGPGQARRGSKCSLASRGSKGSINTDNDESSWDFSSHSFGSDFFENGESRQAEKAEGGSGRVESSMGSERRESSTERGNRLRRRKSPTSMDGDSDSDTPRQMQKSSRFQFNEIRVKRPIERLFDATMESYSEASRLYYLKLFRTGGPPNILSPPPQPLSQPVSHSLSAYKDSSARSSLIDLDISTDINIEPVRRSSKSSFVNMPPLSLLSTSSSSTNLDLLTLPEHATHHAQQQHGYGHTSGQAPEIVIDPTVSSLDSDADIPPAMTSNMTVLPTEPIMRRPTQDWRFPVTALVKEPETTPPTENNHHEPLAMLVEDNAPGMREPDYDQQATISGDMKLALPFSDGVALQDHVLKDDYFSFTSPEHTGTEPESPGSALSVSPKTTHSSLFRSGTGTTTASTTTASTTAAPQSSSSCNTSWYYDTSRLSESGQVCFGEEERVGGIPPEAVRWVSDSSSFMDPRRPPVPGSIAGVAPGKHAQPTGGGGGHATTNSEPNVPRSKADEYECSVVG